MKECIIKFEKFSKTYGHKPVHKDINFSIFKGECFGLLGGSGAGKSVILRSLIGLEKADQGKIFIENEEISSWSEDQLIEVRKKVAYVFQGGALFDSMTVFENLAYPLKAHSNLSTQEIQKKVCNLLKDFGLQGSEYVLPSKLSGGMQKRVGLLRAIILDPDIILYDEPTAGLDPYNTIKVQNVILKLKEEGVTSILVTHDIPSAMVVCDRIGFLRNGCIEDIISIEDLKTSRKSVLLDFENGLFEANGESFYE